MSDANPVLRLMGIDGDEPDGSADPVSPDAAAPEATAATDAAGDHESLDEALAALDEEGAPPAQQTAPDPPDPEPAAAPYADLPPEVAAKLAEYDQLKAEKAEVEAATEYEQVLEPWGRQQQANDAFFDAEMARIQTLGERENRTQDEIDAAIYRRVELGQGFGVQRVNAHTGQVETVGRIQLEREFEENLRRFVVTYERAKSQPSAVDQLANHYQLDANDRTALAALANQPREVVETMARALAAKTQRQTTQHTQITQQAAQNLATRLSQQVAPGAGATTIPAKKPFKDYHTDPTREREATTMLFRRLGMVS